MRRRLLIWWSRRGLLPARSREADDHDDDDAGHARGRRTSRCPTRTHLKNLRQLTFGGDNAEAYWSFGGDRLIFQTNHAAVQVRPDRGHAVDRRRRRSSSRRARAARPARTSSRAIKEIIYASTHEVVAGVPDAARHVEGLPLGPVRVRHLQGERRRLEPAQARPTTPGYDAEATVCPKDGSIIFTSMRSRRSRAVAHGRRRQEPPPADEHARLRRRRVLLGRLHARSCGASSRPQGKDLEEYKALLAQNLVKPTKMDLWVANADGTDAHQVTYLPGASFAPYFYPDGKRILFSSNYREPARPRVRPATRSTSTARTSSASRSRRASTASRCSRPTARRSRSRRTAATSIGTATYRVTGTPAGEHDTNVFLADWVDSARRSRPPETAAADRYRDGDRLPRRRRARRPRHRHEGPRATPPTSCSSSSQRPASSPASTASGARRSTSRPRSSAAPTTALALDGKPRRRRRLRADAVLGEQDRRRRRSSPPATASSTPSAKLDDYKGKNVKGKIVARPSLHAERRSARARSSQARLGDLRYKAFTARGKGAIGLIVVDDGDPKQEEAPLPSLATDGMADLVSGGATPAFRSSSSSARPAPRSRRARTRRSSPSRSSRCARRPTTSSA